MNAEKYQQIQSENLSLSVEKLGLPPDWIFQLDNDPKHTAKSTKRLGLLITMLTSYNGPVSHRI